MSSRLPKSGLWSRKLSISFGIRSKLPPSSSKLCDIWQVLVLLWAPLRICLGEQGCTCYFSGALWESLNNSSERTAQLLWAVELVTVAEAQVTQAGLWPEGEKPGRVPQREEGLGLWEEPR